MSAARELVEVFYLAALASRKQIPEVRVVYHMLGIGTQRCIICKALQSNNIFFAVSKPTSNNAGNLENSIVPY